MIALPCPLPDRPVPAIAGTGCGVPDVGLALHVADASRSFILDYESFFEITRRDGQACPPDARNMVTSNAVECAETRRPPGCGKRFCAPSPGGHSFYTLDAVFTRFLDQAIT
ncbi:hypothetical protein [Burkholderia ubonensis]|uniref:hypothetical protein n=1 Tax=Burkholderia ubonensis TaxID=101571 RepID=UPI0012FA831E|nr:hypothetical protein [Burkholderia ubonensis]